MPKFKDFHLSATSGLGARRYGVAPGAMPPSVDPAQFQQADKSADDASRAILERLLEASRMKALTSPKRPEVMPDMRLQDVGISPALGASTVTYQQVAAAIPIFGSRVTVDVGKEDRAMVAINGRVASPPTLDPIAGLSAADAVDRLARWGDVENRTIKPTVAPTLTWFLDEQTGQWHLAYRFLDVPMRPVDEQTDDDRRAPDLLAETYEYLVDANDGEVLYYFNTGPRFGIPVTMSGIDCAGNWRSFFGQSNAAGAFVLSDPLRGIETYDLCFADLSAQPQPPLPDSPLSSPTATLGADASAAVSAHYHATVVYDFYNQILKRNGIDGKGMKLVNVVNVDCRSRNDLPPTRWANARWSQGRMWFGQDVIAGSADPVSFARFLDVIAHELTHGVIQTTCNLVNRDQPGALNESFSDIFGILISNWGPSGFPPISQWCWQIGAGLGVNGCPMRDISNPALTGQPAHMRDYVPLEYGNDRGGVHHYCGIHSKAVHGLLTATTPEGDPAVGAEEVALLMYLTLTRLAPTSDFLACLATLLSVAGARYAQDPALTAQKLATIRAAYDAVGIK